MNNLIKINTSQIKINLQKIRNYFWIYFQENIFFIILIIILILSIILLYLFYQYNYLIFKNVPSLETEQIKLETELLNEIINKTN